MKLVKAAGAIVLGFYMCNAGVSASAVDMIQEEVQGAIEGRVIDWDAEVVKKATGKLEGERGELPAGRALKSPKASKSCKASKSSKSTPSPTSSPLVDGWNAVDGEVYEALLGSNDVTNVEFTGESAVIDLGTNFKWFGDTFSKICLYSTGWISIGESCGFQGLGFIDFVYSAFLEPPFRSVKYLKKSFSLKISFEDVPFKGDVENVQAQVELFENGDVLICYGEGDIPAEKYFDARVGDYTSGGPIEDPPFDDYRIQDLPFDGNARTSVWPECKCWKFKMPLPPPS